MTLTPEIVLREVAQRALQVLHKYPAILDALLQDEERLIPGFVASMKAQLALNANIPVVANYPTPDLSVPNISIVTQASTETSAFLGDLVDDQATYDLSDSVGGILEMGTPDEDYGANALALSDTVGWFDDSTFRIVLTTTNETFTAVLSAALRFMLFHAKLRLESVYSMLDVKLDEADFAFPQDYWPTLTWSKAITLRANVLKAANLDALRNTEDSALWDGTLPSIRDIIADIVL